MAVSSYLRSKQMIRDGKGQILGMRPRTAEEVVEFILANSARDQATGCLVCKLRKDGKGYPRVAKHLRVHNVIFFKGLLPPRPRPHVLHSCDNRACVEEAHLYKGTNKQNIADKVSRDRSGKKLNIAKARRIKAMLRQGHKHQYIARMFGISPTTVHHIKSGRQWAHVKVARGTDSVVEIPSEPVT